MTTTDVLHEKIGAYRIGRVQGVCSEKGCWHECIVEPSKDLVRLKVRRETTPHSLLETFEVIQGLIEGIGQISFYGCKVIGATEIFGASELGTLTLLPSMISIGWDDYESISRISYAQLRCPVLSRDHLPASYKMKFKEGIIKNDDVEIELYKDDLGRIWISHGSRMAWSSNEISYHSASIEELTWLNFKYSKVAHLSKVRQRVVHTCLILSAFYLRKIRCTAELYDLPGRPDDLLCSAIYDRFFHLNMWSPVRYNYGFKHNLLSSIQPVLKKFSKFLVKHPNLGDIFWHSSVHAHTISRVAIDSFLVAGRLAEEMLHLMKECGLDVVIPKGSSIAAILSAIHIIRPFKVWGSWINFESSSDYYQDTRNLYAHGHTRQRNNVLYGYDINFMALTIHIHLFSILGELLGLPAKPLTKARDGVLDRAHEIYLGNQKIGSPLASMTQGCEWKFA